MNALGVYLLVSLFFVVSTMFEFAVVLLLKQIPEWKMISKMRDKRRRKQRATSDNTYAKTKKDGHRNPLGLKLDQDAFEILMVDNDQTTSSTHKIDISALAVFTVLYILFNITYWIYVLGN